MGDFYRRLSDRDAGVLRAFDDARRALRARRPEPFFWAPFIFIGEPD